MLVVHPNLPVPLSPSLFVPPPALGTNLFASRPQILPSLGKASGSLCSLCTTPAFPFCIISCIPFASSATSNYSVYSAFCPCGSLTPCVLCCLKQPHARVFLQFVNRAKSLLSASDPGSSESASHTAAAFVPLMYGCVIGWGIRPCRELDGLLATWHKHWLPLPLSADGEEWAPWSMTSPQRQPPLSYRSLQWQTKQRCFGRGCVKMFPCFLGAEGFASPILGWFLRVLNFLLSFKGCPALSCFPAQLPASSPSHAGERVNPAMNLSHWYKGPGLSTWHFIFKASLSVSDRHQHPIRCWDRGCFGTCLLAQLGLQN